MNDLADKWSSIIDPINDFKDSTMKACKLDKTKGSSISHVIMGLVITMISDMNMT